jgi:SAM-dependent methyltransferase
MDSRQPANLAQLSRVYGPETWDVYAQLDETLAPRGPDSLYDLAGVHLVAGSTVLDAGCRDAAHLIRLVQRFDVTGIGVDPVQLHVDRANEAIEAAGVADRASVLVGALEALPFGDGQFNLIWCRDVLEQVDDLDRALRESFRLLAEAGRMLVYTTFATDRLTAEDADLLNHHLGNVPANLDEAKVRAAFARAGFAIELRDAIGTEWREHLEERDGTTSRALLRLSRLRRQRDELTRRFGLEIYEHVEANLHWEVFQFLGKLQPTVYVLRKDG